MQASTGTKNMKYETNENGIDEGTEKTQINNNKKNYRTSSTLY